MNAKPGEWVNGGKSPFEAAELSARPGALTALAAAERREREAAAKMAGGRMLSFGVDEPNLGALTDRAKNHAEKASLQKARQEFEAPLREALLKEEYFAVGVCETQHCRKHIPAEMFGSPHCRLRFGNSVLYKRAGGQWRIIFSNLRIFNSRPLMEAFVEHREYRPDAQLVSLSEVEMLGGPPIAARIGDNAIDVLFLFFDRFPEKRPGIDICKRPPRGFATSQGRELSKLLRQPNGALYKPETVRDALVEYMKSQIKEQLVLKTGRRASN